VRENEVFKVLKSDLKKDGLTKWDWNDFIKSIDAPEDLVGLFSVAQNMSIITKMMKSPIVREEDAQWINKLHKCACTVENNLILLTTKFGASPTHRPPTGASIHPLYYCLFHTCIPGTEPQFHYLLMWSYIAFFKAVEQKTTPTLSASTLYYSFLGLRSLFDKFVKENAVSKMNLKLTTMQDVAENLRKIKQHWEVLGKGPKIQINIRRIITLLDPHPKDVNRTSQHSEHPRSYFLPTPRRGYVPLTARLVNKRYCFLLNHKWGPREISISDIQEREKHIREEFSNGFSGEMQTKHSLIQTRKDIDSPAKLFIYKMKSIANSIARNNQDIPHKSSISLKEDVFEFFTLIQDDSFDLEKQTMFSLNILTGIPLEILAKMPLINSIEEIDTGILYMPSSNYLFIPVRKPVRKSASNDDSPTHFPLRIPNQMCNLLSRLHVKRQEIIKDFDIQNKDFSSKTMKSKKKPRLFLHHSKFYKKSMQIWINEVHSAKKLNISRSGVENTIVRIGLELGIDPVILGQISQKSVARSETQTHYTNIPCKRIQSSYDLILSDFFNLTHGEKALWQ